MKILFDHHARKHMAFRRLSASVIVLALLSSIGCAGKRPEVVVGQTGLAIAKSIGQLQATTKQLTDSQIIPPATALAMQQKLLAINGKLAPLPEMLRTIDRIVNAGSDPDAKLIDSAVAILTVVGQDLSVVVAGVPISAAVDSLVKLILATQQVIQTSLIEMATLKGAVQ